MDLDRLPIVLVAVTAADHWRGSEIPLFVLAVALISIGARDLLQRRNANAAMAIAGRHDEVMAQLAQGRARDAADSLTAVAGDSRCFPLLRAYALHNLGVAKIWLSEFDDAITCFDALERADAFKNNEGMKTLLYCNAALSSALGGSIDAAESMLAKIDSASITKHRAELVYVRAVIALQRGEHERALALLRENGNELESELSARRMRIVRILTAFGLDRIGAAPAEIESMIAGARPARRGDFAFPTVHWPELKAFLVQRGFTVELELM